MDEETWRQKIKSTSKKFNSKTSLRGILYDGDLFCSNTCFSNIHRSFEEDKLQKVYVYTEYTAGEEHGICCQCDEKIDTSSPKMY